MINNESLAGWKADPVTLQIFKEIEAMITELSNALSDGQTISESSGQTALQTARVVGEIKGLSQILNISYEEDEKEEENPNG